MHFIAALATSLGLIPRRFQSFNVSLEIEKAHPSHSVQFSENIYIWLENNQVLIACLQTFLGLTGEQGWSIWIGPREIFLDGFDSITSTVNFWLLFDFLFQPLGIKPRTLQARQALCQWPTL